MSQLTGLKISLKKDDVIPTGNEWISLPTVRASDGALENFNVMYMKARGLVEMAGPRGLPLVSPFVLLNGRPVPFTGLAWSLQAYWIPTAHFQRDGLEVSLTYCAPAESRGVMIRLKVRNARQEKVRVEPGLDFAWDAVNRVTYAPRRMKGALRIGEAPWVSDARAFFYDTHDTYFSFCLRYPGGRWQDRRGKAAVGGRISRAFSLAPGQEADFGIFLGVGLDEFSSGQAAKNLSDLADRLGADGLVTQAAAWCAARTRPCKRPDLAAVMNRNFLFNLFYSWGRALDTEGMASATSRSPRYYVSSAYWDRDAMLWSFPGLLDVDAAFAREALEYALTVQLRNTGIHSRFIDGTVLEGGFQLDEGAAPLLAFESYVAKTGDLAFLKKHRAALDFLRDLLLGRKDPKTGLLTTFQDSQDEYIKPRFNTYSMVISWKALLDAANLYARLKEGRQAAALKKEAASLKAAILKHCVVDGAPGARGTIFARAWDHGQVLFNDVPPGSLAKLPILGFVKEDFPAFRRTWDWLHSKNYPFNNQDKPYGLYGSWRVSQTCCWTIADQLRLKIGHARALKVLEKATWDGGIVSEMLDPATADGISGGSAFATAAGYVAHAVYEVFGEKRK
jgi:hypothetical protein